MGERWTDAFVLQESETPDELILHHDQSPRARRLRLGVLVLPFLFPMYLDIQGFVLRSDIRFHVFMLAMSVMGILLFWGLDQYSISVSIADDTAVFDYQWFLGRRRKTVDLTDAFRATPKLFPGVSLQCPEGTRTVRFTTTPLRTRTGKQVKDRIAEFINRYLN